MHHLTEIRTRKKKSHICALGDSENSKNTHVGKLWRGIGNEWEHQLGALGMRKGFVRCVHLQVSLGCESVVELEAA